MPEGVSALAIRRIATPAMLAAGIGLTVFAVAGAEAPAAKPVAAERSAAVAPFSFQDVNGKTYSFTKIRAAKATVFFFSSTQCPISNKYTPRIIEIAKDYRARGVQCFLVNSNREESREKVRRDARERGYPFPAIKDAGARLADLLSAQKTPEAVILDSRGAVRYRGRIDDNLDRAKIIRQDAREALDAILAGRQVARPKTLAFGCVIFRDTVKTAAATTGIPTYTRDIAPIFNRNCLSCHRDGEAAPFALETYQQAKTWAAAIKEYTGRRLMPPWKAVAGHGDFLDAKTLSDSQIAQIAQWADAGAPQGAAKHLPPKPKFPTAAAWQLGRPDAVWKPEGDYTLAAEGRDVYRNYVLPVERAADLWVRGIEFKPDNRAVVHHMILFVDLSGESVQLDAKDPGPGYSVPGTGIGVPQEQSVWVAGWAPGNTPTFTPQGTAFRLPKSAKLVLQVHYAKNGKTQRDCSSIGIFTAKEPVEKELRVGAVVNMEFVLKPGGARQEVTQKFTLPFDATIHTMLPHMHMLGRDMKVTAHLPDGTSRPMVFIADWDFNWQEGYRYREPLRLPKGTTLEMVAHFDNSANNPRQPSSPPQTVTWGEQTTDEMCIAFFQFTLDAEKLAGKPAAQIGTR